MRKSRWKQAGGRCILLIAALVNGLVWGKPAWAGISGNIGQGNQAVCGRPMTIQCNGEKKKGMESAREQAEELYVSATEVMLPEPYRSGYTFIEWNTEPDGSGEFYGAGDVVEITEITLYAVWEKDEMESILNVETATASNAKPVKASTAEGEEIKERAEMTEPEEASGHSQETEPAEAIDEKINRISGIKRATESNARWMEVEEEMVAEAEMTEKEEQALDLETQESMELDETGNSHEMNSDKDGILPENWEKESSMPSCPENEK